MATAVELQQRREAATERHEQLVATLGAFIHGPLGGTVQLENGIAIRTLASITADMEAVGANLTLHINDANVFLTELTDAVAALPAQVEEP